MKNLILASILVASLISCKKEMKPETKSYTQLQKANWLLGEWENQTPEAHFTENWIKKNDSTFTAQSFVIAEKDTVFYENVILEQKNDSLFYIVSVKDQNREKPVSFYLTKSSEKQLVFENPKHDFPNKIIYNKVTNDSVFAEIYGTQNGKDRKELFPMKKKTI
jgi:Domain of unknown function (DUF6265)